MQKAIVDFLYESGPPLHGLFRDGLNINHSAIHSTILATAAGVINDAKLAKTIIYSLNNTGFFNGQVKTTCMISFWALVGLYNLAVYDTSAADIALNYMTREGNRSWIAMMDDWNATMTMEAWSPFDNPPSNHTGMEGITWSHPWCSAPVNIIPRLLMGIQPIEPAWSRIAIRPKPSTLPSVNITV